jgi:hypothetical protein
VVGPGGESCHAAERMQVLTAVVVCVLAGAAGAGQESRADAYRRLAESRLQREGSFAERVDLVRFLDRAIAEVDGAGVAELELLRIRALQESLRDIQRYEPKVAEHRAWIAERRAELSYSEPAAQWLVESDRIWAIEARYRGQPIADDLAWAAATNGLAGECEGFLACYLTVTRMTTGRYLELHPDGRHAGEALAAIGSLLDEAERTGRPFLVEPEDPPRIRAASQEPAIVARSGHPRARATAERLSRLAARGR